MKPAGETNPIKSQAENDVRSSTTNNNKQLVGTLLEEIRRLRCLNAKSRAADANADGQSSDKLVSALLEENKRLRRENKKLAKKAKKAGQKNATLAAANDAMCAQLARSVADLQLRRKEVTRLNNACASYKSRIAIHPPTTTATTETRENSSRTEPSASTSIGTPVASNRETSTASTAHDRFSVKDPAPLAMTYDNTLRKLIDLEVKHARDPRDVEQRAQAYAEDARIGTHIVDNHKAELEQSKERMRAMEDKLRARKTKCDSIV